VKELKREFKRLILILHSNVINVLTITIDVIVDISMPRNISISWIFGIDLLNLNINSY